MYIPPINALDSVLLECLEDLLVSVSDWQIGANLSEFFCEGLKRKEEQIVS